MVGEVNFSDYAKIVQQKFKSQIGEEKSLGLRLARDLSMI